MTDPRLSNKPTPKFTRCRTGCLRCRVRRRKCDEGKPRCRNCVDKDLECQYGLQVSFLPKNTFTVSASELPASKADASYDKIKFVEEDPLTCISDVSADESPSPTSSISTVILADPPTEITTRSHDGRNNTSDNILDGSLVLPPWTLAESPRDDVPISTKSPSRTDWFSDRDESAVRGLLALGSSTSMSGDPITEATSYMPALDPQVAPSPLTGSTLGDIGPGAVPMRSNFINWTEGRPAAESTIPIPVASAIPEARRLELLRYYRYNVAPWFDLCDMRHPFGIIVAQMAMESEELLSSLMGLSETCIAGHDSHCTKSIPSPRKYGTNLDLYPDSTHVAVLCLFHEVRYLISDISGAWMNTSRYLNLTSSLVQHAYSTGIDSAIYWMFLRLELGVALANDSPIQIPLPALPIPSLGLLSRTGNTYERVCHYAHVLIWICGRAVVMCHQEEPQQIASPNQPTDDWLQLFEELDQWYGLRPQEFQPMVELDGGDQMLNPESEFPLLLFANGAGAFSNQLYHTAMLLLLQCKPRTVLLNNLSSRVLSLLWHAQRICAISLNNDRRECWDPCLLASFLVAAKHMTHDSQQKEILKGFDRIRKLTGWDTEEYLSRLRDDWSFFEGTE